MTRCPAVHILLGILFTLHGVLHSQGALPSSHPKYKTAKQIYDRIVRAVGDGRTAPTFRLLPLHGKNVIRIAGFNPVEHAIVIEEQALDVCSSLGADSIDALALIVGHELAHFYKDHVWSGDFGNAFADREVGKSVVVRDASPEEIVRVEAQADDFGGFYGYLAGYNTLGVAPRALRALYTSYHLAPSSREYPSLEDRIVIAERSEARLRNLLPLYEAGNRLLLLNLYEPAALMFDLIAQHFPSREIINNAGVARALAALSMFDRDSLKFAFPFEFDPSARLRGSRMRGREGSGNEGERRARLLEEAREKFEAARTRDQEYAPALVNLASVSILLGDAPLAVAIASKALDLATKQGEMASRVHALVARGIARASGGEAEKAAADFAAASEQGSQIGTINAARLKGGNGVPLARNAGGGEKVSLRAELIAGCSPRDIEFSDTSSKTLCLPLPDCAAPEYRSGSVQPIGRIILQDSTGWDGMDIKVEGWHVRIIHTHRDYLGTTARGIAPGDPIGKVRDQYGEPTTIVPARRGEFAVFEKGRIVFLWDEMQRVNSWFIYELE